MSNSPELIIEVLEDEECGYRARALGEGIFTHGATLDELRANVRDAVDAYYDGEESRPKIIRLHFVRQEVLTW
ncbi:2-oxoisovalerate dehydrogenase [bacterium]|nr:2-oxoisovalerate dehydrogenase [bacterium]